MSINNRKISVIIPCYNYAKYLGACIESVIDQTHQNWECIIVDDESTDNSLQIAKQYALKDKRVTVISQKNSGPTVARNLALKICTGNFIQFLDADDLLEKHKFENQLNVFNNNNNIDIVYNDAKYFESENTHKLFDNLDLKSNKETKTISGSGDVMITELLKNNIMVISAPLIKKNVFDKFGFFDNELYYNEDWELWARFALNNVSFMYHNSTNTNALIRVHDSYSKDNFKMFLFGLLACKKLIANSNAANYKKTLTPKIAYHKKILDKILLATLKIDKIKAIENANLIYNVTNENRYKFYSTIFKMLPNTFCRVISFCICSFVKVKNSILYA